MKSKYIPTASVPTQTTKINLPMNATEAIARSRSEGWLAEDINNQAMKAMIEVVTDKKFFLENKSRPRN